MAEGVRVEIERRLRQRFEPAHLEIVDDSARHAGHRGAASGGGHYRVTIVAHAFEGASRIDRHRMIHEVLGAMIGREIHAIALVTRAPSEWAENGRS
jgi:BolA protein